MNTAQLSLFGADAIPAARSRCDYFILISPPQKIIAKVDAKKRSLNKTVPAGDKNLHSVAHISLYRMLVPENDDLILQKLRRALAHLYRFTVRLNGAELFKHGRSKISLVLTIENPEPVRMIHAFIAREFRTSRSITPHLTIARDIPSRYAEKIRLQDFQLYDEFLCEKITVLKKTDGQEHFSVLFEIPLLQY